RLLIGTNTDVAYVVDTATNQVVDQIDVSLQGSALAVAPGCSGTIAVIGTGTGDALKYDLASTPATFLGAQREAGGATVTHVAFSRDGTKVFVGLNIAVSTIDENNQQTAAGNVH